MCLAYRHTIPSARQSPAPPATADASVVQPSTERGGLDLSEKLKLTDASPQKLTPDQARALYEELKQTALGVTPAFLKLAPEFHSRGQPFGALMEFRTGGDTLAAISCVLEAEDGFEHVALYTNGGFGVIGENLGPLARAAARRFILLMADYVSELTPTKDIAPGPGPKRVRFYALTAGGLLTAEATTEAGEFAPLERAGHEVVVAIRDSVDLTTPH